MLGPRLDQARYFLLLNDDAFVEPDALHVLVEYMDAHPRVGIVGARLLYPDGSPQSSYAAFPTGWDEVFYLWGLGKLVPKKIRRRFATVIRPFSRLLPRLGRVYLENWFHTPDAPIEVDWVCGAALMARRETIEQIGLLDAKAFFMYLRGHGLVSTRPPGRLGRGLRPERGGASPSAGEPQPGDAEGLGRKRHPVLHQARHVVRCMAAARERRREGGAHSFVVGTDVAVRRRRPRTREPRDSTPSSTSIRVVRTTVAPVGSSRRVAR